MAQQFAREELVFLQLCCYVFHPSLQNVSDGCYIRKVISGLFLALLAVLDQPHFQEFLHVITVIVSLFLLKIQ